MFDEQKAKLAINELKSAGIQVAPGLSRDQILRIEAAYGVGLPKDLQYLLGQGVPVQTAEGELFPDWRGEPELLVKEANKLIDSAFIFDIEENGYWHDIFGIKPADDKIAVEQALRTIRTWPPLIHIFAHRFMTTDRPHDNPVLSVWQATDTVYYGYNLSDYLIKEFDIDLPVEAAANPPRISKWGEAFDVLNERS
jgi:hypothetical protein